VVLPPSRVLGHASGTLFRWIKQHLRIKAYGTTENAVKTQISANFEHYAVRENAVPTEMSVLVAAVDVAVDDGYAAGR
jgi:hypothetical protein